MPLHPTSVNRGFTLIEVLIALLIFALLASMTGGVIYRTFQTDARINNKQELLNTIQTALTLLRHDTQSMIFYTSEKYPKAFIGKPNAMTFTKASLNASVNEKDASSIDRIMYVCKQHALIRQHFTLQGKKEMRLLDNLAHCSFHYLSQKNQLITHWNTTKKSPQAIFLPKAIELRLNITHWGKASFLFSISESV